jgi:hypothetical protein
MVEKWLLQVEDMMISSVRKVILDSVQAYKETPRKRWVIEWPGQITLCVSCIYWTKEVMEAMAEEDGLQVMPLRWSSSDCTWLIGPDSKNLRPGNECCEHYYTKFSNIAVFRC